MTHAKRITQLVHDAAEQAAPGDLDLWPAIRARLQPQALPVPRRRKGAITLAAVLVVVIAAVLAFALNDDHGDHRGRKVHTSGLNQTLPPASPLPSLVAYQPTPTPTATSCLNYVAFKDQQVLYSEPDTNSKPVYEPVFPNTPLQLLSSKTIDQAQWYEVNLWLEQFDFHGWVQGEPVTTYCQPMTVVGSFYVGSFSVKPISNTYSNESLGVPVEVPAGWIPYADPVLNRPYTVTAASFFASADDVRPFDPANLPTHGPALIVLHIADPESLGLAQTAPLNTEAILRPLLGRTPELDPGRVSSFYADQGSSGILLFMLLAPPGSDLQVLRETLFWPMLKAAGIVLPATTMIESQNFSAEGVYSDTGALTRDEPLHNYGIDTFNMPAQYLSGAEGYVILSVDGAEYTPNLYVEEDERETNKVLGQYWTNNGAILMQWVKNGVQKNAYYNASVEGNLTTKLGGYTFTIRPITAVLDLTQGPQAVTLDYRTPQVVRYTPNAAGPVRLAIAVGNGAGGPAPDVAVILPGGVTLARFNPGQTSQLNLLFTPPAGSDPLILFYPLDTTASEKRGAINLFISAEPPGPQASSGTPIPVPSGKVAVSIPRSGYVILSGDAADLAGKKVSVAMSFLYVNMDSTYQMVSPGTPIPQPLASDIPVPKAVTQPVIQEALVIAVDQETDVITLAVSPEEATLMQWARDAKVPLILKGE